MFIIPIYLYRSISKCLRIFFRHFSKMYSKYWYMRWQTFVMKASPKVRDLLKSFSWLWPPNPLLQVRIFWESSLLVSLWDPLNIFLMSFSLVTSYCWSSFTVALDCVRSSALLLSSPLRTSFLLMITFTCFFNSLFLIFHLSFRLCMILFLAL